MQLQLLIASSTYPSTIREQGVEDERSVVEEYFVGFFVHPLADQHQSGSFGLAIIVPSRDLLSHALLEFVLLVAAGFSVSIELVLVGRPLLLNPLARSTSPVEDGVLASKLENVVADLVREAKEN